MYSCRYVYANGAIALSVKELGTKAATVSYVSSLGRIAGRRADKLPLGQGAFWTTNGSVVVRKDTKVLLVDAANLPPTLGRWSLNPAAVADTVATAIMGCWTGQ